MKSFRFKLGILLAIVAGASLISQFVYRNIVTSLHGSLFISISTLEAVHAAEKFHAALHLMLIKTIREEEGSSPSLREEYVAAKNASNAAFASLYETVAEKAGHDPHFSDDRVSEQIVEIGPVFESFKRETDFVFSGSSDQTSAHVMRARALFDEIFEKHLNTLHLYHQESLEKLKTGAHDLNNRVDFFFLFQRGILLGAGIAALLFSQRVLLRGFSAAERNALFDSLTGLRNRRYLEELLLDEIPVWLHAKTQFSIILADLDNFKNFNDTYGHQAGDVALAEVAGKMRKGLRKSDTVIRYGGEEFLAILPDIDKAAALCVAEKVREQIESAELALPSGQIGKIT
ncbi:MAG: GGDEF domain-containing protein, partial [Rectinemataceae bacterium]|nr:GGDEF domain-containing protein [Rectinemataceae bacterium]